MICEYRNHVKALMKMDLIARNAKETIDSIKEYEESNKIESDSTPVDPIYTSLSKDNADRIKRYENRKRHKRNGKLDEMIKYGATSCEYIGYIRTNGRSIEDSE